jgi:hypothetical protein
MKRIIAFWMLCCLFATCLFADNQATRYYTQLKIVTKDRKEQKGDGKGQFISFNDKGCYDSDKSGYTVNNGFLKYGKTSNDRVYYSGNSYWGEAMYIFTENYGRLNILVQSDSTTYVYVLANPPKDTYTCALIKKVEKSSPNHIPIIINPVTSAPDGGGTSPKRDEYGYVSCPQCYGTGSCSGCNGSGWSNITYTGDKHVCANCSGKGKCTSCKGTGKVYRKIR